MPVILVEHARTHTSGILLRSLVDHGLRVQTVRISEEETLPDDLSDLDGVVSLGGPQSAMDDSLPWIEQEIAFLLEASKKEVPILGIGLGSNLIARALGGTLVPADPATAGFQKINLDPTGRDDPLFRGLPWFGHWPTWSRDTISKMPEGSRLLAGRPGDVIDGFGCGIFTYGIGFEPDWTATTLIERLQDGSAPIASEIEDSDSMVATLRGATEPIQRQASRFAENVASYLMPIERVNAGVAKDIHH